ncbi:hypothetical protein F2Q70_00025705 [Brassica cretica]|uniref:Uncharacterized protein n=1 Tax=Brassica cretica TaxID=69181 RepID=A0A8S9LA89_BRACR|nr:hypothetical protein F2Q70_00025705 [Brassica cretica]
MGVRDVQSLNRDLVRAWTGHNVRHGLARDRSLCCDLVRTWTSCNVATWSVRGPVSSLRPDPCGPVATLRPDPCRPVATLRPEMAKTRGGGRVGSPHSRCTQGLEVQVASVTTLKVNKRSAKKVASPKQNLFLTPTRRSSRIKNLTVMMMRRRRINPTPLIYLVSFDLSRSCSEPMRSNL